MHTNPPYTTIPCSKTCQNTCTNDLSPACSHGQNLIRQMAPNKHAQTSSYLSQILHADPRSHRSIMITSGMLPLFSIGNGNADMISSLSNHISGFSCGYTHRPGARHGVKRSTYLFTRNVAVLATPIATRSQSREMHSRANLLRTCDTNNSVCAWSS